MLLLSFVIFSGHFLRIKSIDELELYIGVIVITMMFNNDNKTYNSPQTS